MDIEVVLLNRIRTETSPRAKSNDYIIRIKRYLSEARISQITTIYEAGQPHQPPVYFM